MLQLDDAQLRVVERQLFQVVQRRAAPSVNRLVIVADAGETRFAAAEQAQQFVLRAAGVLVLIHQHMAQEFLPLLTHGIVLAQQLEGQIDQVVKIHTLVGQQALLVAPHQQRDLHQIGIPRAGGLGAVTVQAFALPAADLPLPTARFVIVGRATRVFQNGQNIVAGQNRKILLQAQRRAIFAQQLHAQSVKGANQHFARSAADQLARALAHLGSGFVGKGDGGDALGLQTVLDKESDFLRDDAGFTRARARDHQAGALGVMNGFELGNIELGWGRHQTGKTVKEAGKGVWVLDCRAKQLKNKGAEGQGMEGESALFSVLRRSG